MSTEERPGTRELTTLAQLIRSDTKDVSQQSQQLQPSATELLHRLDYHGITLLALERGTLSPKLVDQLASRKAMMVANEALKQNALIELFEAFNSAGLWRNVLFKGSALAYSIYPQPWLRPRSDSDCLIHRSEHPAFEQVFEQLGYRKLFAVEGNFVSYQSTYSKKLAGKSAMNVDLHWRINNRQTLANSFSVDELIASGSTLAKLSANIKVPHPVDSILISSLHRLGHHHAEERLAWLYDIHLLANQLTEADWALLVEKAQRKKLAGVTLNALQYCEKILGTPIINQVHRDLKQAAELPEPSQIFLQRELPEWRYFVADIRALNGWREKISFVSENVFPNSEYVKQQMGTRSATKAYLKRTVRGLRRITG